MSSQPTSFGYVCCSVWPLTTFLYTHPARAQVWLSNEYLLTATTTKPLIQSALSARCPCKNITMWMEIPGPWELWCDLWCGNGTFQKFWLNMIMHSHVPLCWLNTVICSHVLIGSHCPALAQYSNVFSYAHWLIACWLNTVIHSHVLLCWAQYGNVFTCAYWLIGAGSIW